MSKQATWYPRCSSKIGNWKKVEWTNGWVLKQDNQKTMSMSLGIFWQVVCTWTFFPTKFDQLSITRFENIPQEKALSALFFTFTKNSALQYCRHSQNTLHYFFKNRKLLNSYIYLFLKMIKFDIRKNINLEKKWDQNSRYHADDASVPHPSCCKSLILNYFKNNMLLFKNKIIWFVLLFESCILSSLPSLGTLFGLNGG